MRRRYLPIEQLHAWATLNGVTFVNTRVERLSNTIAEGAGFFANCDFEINEHYGTVLLSVPPDLVLSKDLVAEYAKSDRHLRDVLEAVGEFGRSTRGAILVFLLLQITHSSPDLVDEKVGVTNPFTDYVCFLPRDFSLPTFYSEAERALLQGTSLADAVDQKLGSLADEFDLLRSSTREMPWCEKLWWDDETGRLTIDDWKLVDAMYRSRALELPGTGHAMVPCVDMANHASDDQTAAIYETDDQKNAVLQLRWGRSLQQGEEITITYGDEKGASEMIFSYGFLEGDMASAKQLFLGLEIPIDDPLRMAKKTICREAPGVRLYIDPEDGTVRWESKFVWWACVNEEDGLEFRVLQDTDGEKELHVRWKGKGFQSETLAEVLAQDPLREVFELRAVVLLLERIELQASTLEGREEDFSQAILQSDIRDSTWETIGRLRELELDLFAEAYQSLQSEVRSTFPQSTANKVQARNNCTRFWFPPDADS